MYIGTILARIPFPFRSGCSRPCPIIPKTYVPAFVGLDYTYVTSHYTYRQLLYQTIKRAIALGFYGIDFGLTASFEKRKLGAEVSERFAYVQASDNYVLELLGTM